MKPILCVVLNYRRPANIPLVLEALRQQTIPVHIALVDCAAGTPFRAPDAAIESADVTIRINAEFGPLMRMLPLVMLPPEFDFAYFAPDDMLPGSHCLAWMQDAARMMDHHGFAAVGQDGHRIIDHQLCPRHGRMVPNKCTPVDYIVGGEMIRASWGHMLFSVRRNMIQQYGSEFSILEHDVFIGLASQIVFYRMTGKRVPCYLTPEPPNELYQCNASRLPSPHALQKRTNWKTEKQRMVDHFIRDGWVSGVMEATQ